MHQPSPTADFADALVEAGGCVTQTAGTGPPGHAPACRAPRPRTCAASRRTRAAGARWSRCAAPCAWSPHCTSAARSRTCAARPLARSQAMVCSASRLLGPPCWHASQPAHQSVRDTPVRGRARWPGTCGRGAPAVRPAQLHGHLRRGHPERQVRLLDLVCEDARRSECCRAGGLCSGEAMGCAPGDGLTSRRFALWCCRNACAAWSRPTCAPAAPASGRCGSGRAQERSRMHQASWHMAQRWGALAPTLKGTALSASFGGPSAPDANVLHACSPYALAALSMPSYVQPRSALRRDSTHSIAAQPLKRERGA